MTTPGSGYTVGDIIFMTSVGVNVQATVSAIGLSGEIQDVTFSYMTDYSYNDG